MKLDANDDREFLVLRFSLVEESQNTLDMEAIPSPKGAGILLAIIKDREFVLNAVRYSFVGFAEASPTPSYLFPASRFYIGKTAKLKQTRMGKKIPGDIVETEEDDWLPVLTIFDIQEQYIFVRKDSRFGTPEQTIRAIEKGLREPVLLHYNHRVYVEGVSREERFWNVIGSHRKIYKLELSLISPNILEANKCARDAVAALKEMFAQDKVRIVLSSESGDLHIPKAEVNDYLEYISEGEGTWGITTEGIRGGKKNYSSSDNIETVHISVPKPSDAEEIAILDLIEEVAPLNQGLPNSSIAAEVFIEIQKLHEPKTIS